MFIESESNISREFIREIKGELYSRVYDKR